MKYKNILFICKYNRFRSRIAEAYFKKINRDKRIRAISAGLIKGDYPLNSFQIQVARKLGINLAGKPQGITTEMLKWQDLLIIVADNIPRSVFAFNEKTFGKKTLYWNIKDVKKGSDIKDDERAIKQIMSKTDDLIKFLEKENKK